MDTAGHETTNAFWSCILDFFVGEKELDMEKGVPIIQKLAEGELGRFVVRRRTKNQENKSKEIAFHLREIRHTPINGINQNFEQCSTGLLENKLISNFFLFHFSNVNNCYINKHCAIKLYQIRFFFSEI
ncbi:hypothetical protein B9Z55_002586 [Caenorhabditis nigoni]|uniref:Uncharacterized protein n=1 Tax=Caenorhabditis nigoni TaxID=1611254 RepID=A0A2G5VL66_9PELO|nr:hypothetical protein B9Z55_002586 [Caenorhabditis nigoni]